MYTNQEPKNNNEDQGEHETLHTSDKLSSRYTISGS